ncbi:PIN domain-containing protein [Candidatus Venteria ishoeyi]|uniref:type II toxin-antitoxin system VapC family toxin n=1 Tax=Candidatus Venteria ishoeyi TaxID=1899563 RepID=UPI0025A60773|nr:PIN domain-containing protein [Candidatus Venteria ishoeyi]MDM8545833.1 PIN domain-containing protein [Candidatus Venteria ishoeyi]
MLKPIFVDTGFVIGLVNERDTHHAEALRLSEYYETYPFVTTDAVLLEVGNALAKSFKPQGTEIIDYFINSADTTVIHLNALLFKRGFDLYQSHADKSWGLVDCVSFVVMREMEIEDALTFDKHFTQAGFQKLSIK